ncbi:MAG: hypothetical protein MHM6MM_001477 [Cercozoa sp. M6MM]
MERSRVLSRAERIVQMVRKNHRNNRKNAPPEGSDRKSSTSASQGAGQDSEKSAQKASVGGTERQWTRQGGDLGVSLIDTSSAATSLQATFHTGRRSFGGFNKTVEQLNSQAAEELARWTQEWQRETETTKRVDEAAFVQRMTEQREKERQDASLRLTEQLIEAQAKKKKQRKPVDLAAAGAKRVTHAGRPRDREQSSRKKARTANRQPRKAKKKFNAAKKQKTGGTPQRKFVQPSGDF